MHRTIAALAVGALLTGACAPAPAGPRQPIEQEQLSGDEAWNSAGARATAIAFVQAYGAADAGGLAAMTALAGTPLVGDWVHWQAVQYTEFPGSVDGTVDLRVASAAEAVTTIPGTSALLREVALDATVTFDYTPDEGDPFAGARTIDAIRVAREEATPWAVVDLVRDGVPISTTFQPVGVTVRGEGAAIELDSFVSDPATGSWQFDLVARATVDSDLALESAALIDADGRTVATATSVTDSLASILSGRPVEGLVRFDALDDAKGITLRLTFAGAPGDGTAEFPLEALIEPVPTASPVA
jgi:hypothetical protein